MRGGENQGDRRRSYQPRCLPFDEHRRAVRHEICFCGGELISGLFVVRSFRMSAAVAWAGIWGRRVVQLARRRG